MEARKFGVKHVDYGQNYHRKIITKLTFRTLVLRLQSYRKMHRARSFYRDFLFGHPRFLTNKLVVSNLGNIYLQKLERVAFSKQKKYRGLAEIKNN